MGRSKSIMHVWCHQIRGGPRVQTSRVEGRSTRAWAGREREGGPGVRSGTGPGEQVPAGRGDRTPFHERTAARSETPWYFNWDLCHVVDVYDDFHAELGAIRTNVAMGDMSPLCKILVEGPDAGRLVDRLIPRRIDDLVPGGIFYTPWCSHDGKVVSDGWCSAPARIPISSQGTPPASGFSRTQRAVT